MATVLRTPKLDLVRVQEEWQFGDEAFNKFIDDADDKLVGVDHLSSNQHWDKWKADTVYKKNDVVRYEALETHQYASCIVGGTSGSDEPINNVTGSIITDGTVEWQVCSLTESVADGGVIKVWLGGGVYYTRGEPVIYGTALYRCRVDHFSASTFEEDNPKWQEIMASIRPWQPSRFYYVGDTVINDNILYRCIIDHTSESSFNVTEEAKWDKVSGGGNGVEDWQATREYAQGSVVVINNVLYRANADHTASTSFADDISNWTVLNAPIADWESGIYYPQGSMIIQNKGIYKCNTGHTSSTAFATDLSNWTQVGGGNIEDWEASHLYIVGDMVIYNSCIYKCTVQHTSTAYINMANWKIIYSSIQLWAKDITYPVGTVVLYNREFYRCNTLHISSDFENELDKWTYVGGDIILEDWKAGEVYKIHQTVVYNSVLFRCISSHTSSSAFSSDYANWERLGGSEIKDFTANVLYFVDDMCIYNNNLYRCTTEHTSTTTFSATNWEIVYSSINLWQTKCVYLVGSTVIYDNGLYRCTSSHTSSTFSANASNWQLIGERGILSVWSSNKHYNLGQAVIYNNCIYRCSVEHTSGTSFDASSFTPLYSSIQNWKSGVYYYIGDTILHDNSMYVCKTAHTSSSFESDSGKWNLLFSSIRVWTTKVYYKVDELVLYDNVLYKCNTNHTSDSFNLDAGNWDLVYANIREYANDTIYKVGSIVINNNKLYKCVVANTSSSINLNERQIFRSSGNFISVWYTTETPASYIFDLGQVYKLFRVSMSHHSDWDENYFTNIIIEFSVDGVNFTEISNLSGITSQGNISVDTFADARYVKITAKTLHYSTSAFSTVLRDFRAYIENNYWVLLDDTTTTLYTWKSGSRYEVGNLIYIGNNLYRCKTKHLSSVLSNEMNNWVPILPNIPDWNVKTNYLDGQYVRYDGKLYRCNVTHTSNSTNFYSDRAKWDSLSANLVDWVSGKGYSKGDIVIHDDRIYQCLQDNDNATWATVNYWKEISAANDVHIDAWESGVYYSVGNLVEHNNQIYKCTTSHTSSVLVDELDNWNLISGLQIWQDNTTYIEGTLLYYNNKLYRVLEDFVSGNEFETEKLMKINSDLEEWKPNTLYLIDDVVIYDGQIYIARFNFTSGSDFSEDFLAVEKEVNSWKRFTYYQKDTLLVYNSIIYIVTSNFTTTSAFDSSNLSVVSPSAWEQDTDYAVGDIIENNGKLYLVTVAFKSGKEFAVSKLEELVPKHLTDKQIQDILDEYRPETTPAFMFMVQDNAPAHNALYREEDLTMYFDSGKMSEAIADGTFRGIFPGGYIVKTITVGGVDYERRWFVGDLDYFYNSGDSPILTTHHVVLFPELTIGTSYMNSANNINNGYVGSYMWKTTLPKYATAVVNTFGSNHVIQNYRDLLSTANTDGASGAGAGWTGTTSNWAWTTVPAVNLFTEPMVYGGRIASSSMLDVGIGNSQLAIFRHSKHMIHKERNGYWLRAAAASTTFALAYGLGLATASAASTVEGVRPFLLLY